MAMMAVTMFPAAVCPTKILRTTLMPVAIMAFTIAALTIVAGVAVMTVMVAVRAFVHYHASFIHHRTIDSLIADIVAMAIAVTVIGLAGRTYAKQRGAEGQ
jgi:ABC-type multidrug transport system permease subunit